MAIRRGSEVDLGEPDLIPIMSIMCILIPMLIYSFVFFEVKVQEVSMPKYGGGSAGGAQMLNLTVVVGRDGFVVKVQEGANAKETREIKKATFTSCRDGEEVECNCTGPEFEDYNYPELYQVVRALKRQHFPDQNSINFLTLADDKDFIPFKVYARTIDAVRAELALAKKPDEPVESFANLCHYQRSVTYMKEGAAAVEGEGGAAAPAEGEENAAPQRSDGKVPSEMFPKIVFLVQ